MKRNIHTLLMLGAAGIVSAASGQNIPQARITVDVAREEAEIAPTMYGIFFEDINRSADGGMYAELIFNRGFEEKNLPSGCTYNPEDKRVYAPYRAVYSSPEQMRSWSIPWDIEDTHPGWTIEAADGASYSVRIDDTDHLQVEDSKAMYLSIDACRDPFRLVNSGFYGLAVEAGEKLGFLPGDMKEKLDPYLQPLYDALNDMIPPVKLQKFLEEGTVQIAPLAYMRGRTLDNAFVILDEAQNTTLSQIKMFLTRMGRNARFIVTGDVTQIDLPRKSDSGLVRAMEILRRVEGIGIVEFDKRDIVRHPLVKYIVEAFDRSAGAETEKNEQSNIKNE